MKKPHLPEARQPGMTLLEMTVVILVLLALVSILFISASAWKRGADKSANILNIRNIQHSVRGHQNLYGLNPGMSPLDSTEIFLSASNTLGYLDEPTPPGSTGVPAYTYLSIVPNYGELYVNNTSAMNAEYVPPVSMYSTW